MKPGAKGRNERQKMRRVRWYLIALAAVASLSVTVGRQASAMDGSCKDRTSNTAPWQPNRLTFEQCKARNQQQDGDNVFDEQGLIWWDVRG